MADSTGGFRPKCIGLFGATYVARTILFYGFNVLLHFPPHSTRPNPSFLTGGSRLKSPVAFPGLLGLALGSDLPLPRSGPLGYK